MRLPLHSDRAARICGGCVRIAVLLAWLSGTARAEPVDWDTRLSRADAARPAMEVVSAPGAQAFRVDPVLMRSLKEAMVTVGGVDLAEVSSTTMESHRLPGLFFAGEVLDIDGPTGGYNLTAAFATARLAVQEVARRSGAKPAKSADRPAQAKGPPRPRKPGPYGPRRPRSGRRPPR